MTKEIMQNVVKEALEEDLALHDITSDLTMPEDFRISFSINARQDIILCGLDVVDCALTELMTSTKFHHCAISIKNLHQDGDFVKSGDPIIKGIGDAKLIFAAERVILNILQHLSGIATKTEQFIKLLDSSKTKILDTRKTIPNLRVLQKYAVKMGGGENHRMSLSDMVLIKDNHIAACGGISQALKKVKSGNKDKLLIEIECDNLNQVTQVLEEGGADIIMLDNMSPDSIKKAQELIGAKAKIEISGNIKLENIANFANFNVDFISIGSLTHSVQAVDIGLDII